MMGQDQLINAVWVGAMAVLVFFMHAGFGFYEAGMCRKKNTVDTLSHNLNILAVSLVVFWLFGGALMLGKGNGFIGLTGFMPSLIPDGQSTLPALAKHAVPLAVGFAFVIFFADTPATLITGTGAERIRLPAVLILTVIITGVIFPIVGHWVYGGGWLAKLDTPVYDTGSGFVQLCGGCCALAVAIVLGPRKEEFDKERAEQKRSNRPIQVSSMPLVFLGAFILWLGFFAFNTALSMKASPAIGLVIVNTALGGGAGAVAALITIWIFTGNASLRATIVGMLTANVAVTSSVGVIEPWAAVVVGAAAGIVAVFSIRMWKCFRLDDPTEYLTMNVVGGIMGMIAAGLFISPQIVQYYSVTPAPKPGVVYGGGDQMIAQLIATGSIIAFTLPAALLACSMLHRFGLLHVSDREEKEGSDESTHGEEAYEKSEDDDGNSHDEAR